VDVSDAPPRAPANAAASYGRGSGLASFPPGPHLPCNTPPCLSEDNVGFRIPRPLPPSELGTPSDGMPAWRGARHEAPWTGIHAVPEAESGIQRPRGPWDRPRCLLIFIPSLTSTAALPWRGSNLAAPPDRAPLIPGPPLSTHTRCVQARGNATESASREVSTPFGLHLEARERDLLRWIRVRRWPGTACEVPVTENSGDRKERRPGARGRNPACPRCDESRTHRWGTFAHRQRWKCSGCHRTFSDLTGTFLQHTRHLGRWIAFAHHLKEVPTVRQAAGKVGIHRDTALRWRHRLIDASHRAIGRQETLQGPAGSVVLVQFFPFPFDPRLRHDRVAREGNRVSWVLLVDGHGGADEGHPPSARVLAGRGGTGPVAISAFDALAGLPTRGDPLTAHHPDHALVRQFCVPRRRAFLPRILWRERTDELLARQRALRRHFRAFLSWQRRFRGFARENLARYLSWFALLVDGRVPAPLARGRAHALLACLVPAAGVRQSSGSSEPRSPSTTGRG
jgi:transposase-like protein